MKPIIKNDGKEKDQSWEVSLDNFRGDSCYNHNFNITAYGSSEEEALEYFKDAVSVLVEYLQEIEY